MRNTTVSIGAALCAIALGANAAAAVWYVDADNTGSQTGSSWTTAFRTIQPAINAAADAGGGDVWVAEGVYNEARTSTPHGGGLNTGSLMLKPNVDVYGGFAGTETSLGQRDPGVHVAVVDGASSRNGAPAYHVIVAAAGSLLDGFTITGGSATGATAETKAGGGCYSAGVSGSAVNCVFLWNTAQSRGGAVYAHSSKTKRTMEGATTSSQRLPM